MKSPYQVISPEMYSIMSLALLSTMEALLGRARDDLEIWTGLEWDRNPDVLPAFDAKLCLWKLKGSLLTVLGVICLLSARGCAQNGHFCF